MFIKYSELAELKPHLAFASTQSEHKQGIARFPRQSEKNSKQHTAQNIVISLPVLIAAINNQLPAALHRETLSMEACWKGSSTAHPDSIPSVWEEISQTQRCACISQPRGSATMESTAHNTKKGGQWGEGLLNS